MKKVEKDGKKGNSINFLESIFLQGIRFHQHGVLKKLWKLQTISRYAITSWLKRRKFLRENLVVPVAIAFSPTMRCNLSCVGCYARDYPRDGELSLEAIDGMLGSAERMGVFLFVITGGEPLMRDGILEILQQHKRNISLGFSVNRCVGWMTGYWRKNIDYEKSHSNDAIAMVTRSYKPFIGSLEYIILPKRAKVWEANPTKQCEEKFGFRHYDLVRAKHRTKGWVIGSVRSLKAKVMTLRTQESDNFSVSYRKSKLVCRFNRIIYSY